MKIGLTKTKDKQAALGHEHKLITVINQCSKKLSFATSENIDQEIADMLHRICCALGADIGGLFLVDEDAMLARREYQFHAHGVSQCSGVLLAVTMPKLFEQIKHGKSFCVNNINELSAKFNLEKELWQEQGVKSFMVVVITQEGKSIGFLEFKSLKNTQAWLELDATALLTLEKMLSDTFFKKTLYLERKKFASTIENVAMEILEALSLVVEKYDLYTAGHQKRVAMFAVAIAKEMGLSEAQIRNIYFGAALHDIGKIHIPLAILNYSGGLSEVETALMRTHAQLGFDIIKNIKFLGPIGDIVLNHHERLNGSGYPNKLTAVDLSMECRIVAVADVLDAMTSHRPYGKVATLAVTLKELSANKGKLYDTEVVDACIRLFKHKKCIIPQEPSWVYQDGA